MSDFHSLFQGSLDKRKLTIYRLSKELKIDRSTLYQVQNGNRLPTVQHFRQLTAYLQLEADEQKRWLEVWKKERLGAKNYHLHCQVERCVQALDSYASVQKPVRQQKEELSAQTVCVQGEDEAAALLKKLFAACVLSGRREILDIHLPPAFFVACSKETIDAAEGKGKLCVRHLFSLPLRQREEEQEPFFLPEELGCILGIFFLPKKGLEYTPYFYYADEGWGGTLFPYYAISGQWVFLLSADCEKAVYLPDPQAACAYREQFERSISRAAPLFRSYGNPILAMSDTFGDKMQPHREAVSVHFFHQPCLMMHMDLPIARRTIHPDYPNGNKVVEMALQYYVERQVYGQQYYNFFTRGGVAAFLRDGKMREFPDSLVCPIPKEDRRTLIGRLRDFAKAGGNVYCVDEKLVPVPEHVLIDVCFGEQILFSKSEPETLRYLAISEQGLVAGFLDYFRSLPTTPGVLGREESAAILDSLLAQCG